ncbi:fumarylacetoacetate hydrolase family protein [Nocardiopsis suaedae]|uniref:Fumarylacetoacetate hydrolase family protein n=1 Tax=Nocardiopsis suaedae TaxID=3018444 RepID=A0ABT4TKG6_9ACTN|nr:fumarylacetoacetate hydrolase family protein [Nocardiopsis suaedae]MDA2805155.1 fumarylacetoacetate hydrolase family protein [Nocardiopsis suaedae]
MSNDPVSGLLGHRPGKVVAVHLSYASRAGQRGRVPAHPSYFLKPGSSVTGPGTVTRPDGTELLGFEGEIALVIGTAARDVSPDEAWAHVGWVTAADDLGLYDLRYADRGSNVRAKGGDGFTPLGPDLIPAERLDPGRIGIRTWLDGVLVQDDSSAGLIFPFGLMLADLSRVMTLEPGDVVLTGTPAGASVARPGQRVEVEVFSLDAPALTSGRLATDVSAGPALAPWGSPPEADEAQRAAAWGLPPEPVLTPEIRERLEAVAVATLSVQLRRRGLDEAAIDGVRPLVPGRRLVGPARTLRFVPYRKDLFAERGGGFNAQKQLFDTIGPGEVLVMEARGDASAGTLGDILALRAKVRSAAGVVTDGAVRDAAAVASTGLPVFCAGHHPAVLGRRHVPWETDTAIACGGAAVQPGDVIVADDDGALVIPPGLVHEVLEAAEAQEREEEFIAEMVRQGESVDGLYPLNTQWRQRYEAKD